ncbi:MAG: hypothetical protein MUC98_15385, partial [Desulfobacterota bacterium]|nr:hypothetical protein [Thermodesulfobacteriota bacterium]
MNRPRRSFPVEIGGLRGFFFLQFQPSAVGGWLSLVVSHLFFSVVGRRSSFLYPQEVSDMKMR